MTGLSFDELIFDSWFFLAMVERVRRGVGGVSAETEEAERSAAARLRVVTICGQWIHLYNRWQGGAKMEEVKFINPAARP